MSRITDAIDGAGDQPVRLPVRHSGAVASSPERLARAEQTLLAGGSLADALLSALSDLESIEVVGFAAVDAEPFAIAAGTPDDVFAAVRERLSRGGNTAGIGGIPGCLEVVWAAHRGHVAWLHPSQISAARIALALRLAEELDAVRALALSSQALADVAEKALDDADALPDLLRGDPLEALVRSVHETERAPEAAVPALCESIVLFGGDGSALVARASGSPSAFGLVDRGGRPWLLPLHGTDVPGWLTRLHHAIDRDAEPAVVLDAGAVLDGDLTPVLVAPERASALVAPNAITTEA